MSPTLVESFPFPAPHQLLLKDPVVAQPRVSLSFTPPITHRLISREERLVAQLAHLASQHHSSEYNRIKFGPKGCPMIYVPLSIQMPSYIREIQAQQALRASQKAWWPSRVPPSENVADKSNVLGPLIQSTLDIQQEISAAIAEPLSSIPQMLPPNSTLRLQVKTSETHPINVSMIIPFEILPVISSHLTIPRNASPVMFDIPPIYTLNRITAYSLPPTMSLLSTGNPKMCSSFIQVPDRSSVSKALQAVIDAAAANETVQTSGYPWIENTFDFPKHERTYSEPPMTIRSIRDAMNPSHEPKGDWTSDVIRTPVLLHVPSIPDFVSKPPALQNERAPPPSFILGNLYLSSCPGKKVRLNGPVRGRSSVCRDLETDLTRMKDLGVRCVVCCLDDDELEFLGASWSEYSRAADEVGLDVLRIPIPEGFAPLSPSSLDAHLSKLIKTYTMRGVPILVHCRGGVGRAGLVACCWALKLGLCGWIETGAGPAGVIRRDTLQLIERMIDTLRRRRSVKAIETYEQVKFLGDYVDFLRERPAQMGAFGI